ncbi:MAG: hypothetical protein LBV54_05580 [Puniceicoccales bacterium]|jgi:hypothetical protein|nr:hypothetical protein [Puniceicoccales bacterium]
MSNTRNRRQTSGAFGKPKKRVRGSLSRTNRAQKASENKAAPQGGFNISDALINFARPITEQAGNNHTALRGAMNVAILLWNALIEGEAKQADAKEKLLALPGATAEQIEELITTMSARKAELYPDVKQLIYDYSLNFTRRGARIRVSSINVAPPGVETTDIAGQIGAIRSSTPSVAAPAAESAAAPAAEAQS